MDETLVYIGSAVKAMGNGRVGGYLVEFSDPASLKGAPDLDSEYFTRQTDFDIEDGQKATVYYDHGQDPTLKKRKLGRGTMEIRDSGVWFEAQLNLRDDYDKFVYKLAEMGKLGWSSGTSPHLVERKKSVGDFTEITSWPLGNDASLTPMPSSYTNHAVALKSVNPPSLETLLAADKQAEIKSEELTLEGLPALSKLVAPADLKGLAARSESVETAVKEFITHGQVMGDVLKAHTSRVTDRIEFRFKKDGHIPASNLKHIASMVQELTAVSEGFAAIKSDLERLQNDAYYAKSQIMDEAARFEYWDFLRITGNPPKE